MARVEPQHAGAVSGLLSTMQQVGNAAGVALIGLVFFHLADAGTPDAVAHGFQISTAILAGLLVAVAGTAHRLPAKHS
jgi:predicted MFS family arabinose efflux permease